MLLILGGDICKDPGPIKDPCSVCGKCIAKTHRALSCDGCKKWYHIGIKCGNVNNQQYKKIPTDGKRGLVLPSLYEKNATMQKQEDLSIVNEAQTQHFQRLQGSLSPGAALKLPKKGFSLFHLNTRSRFPKVDEPRLFIKKTRDMSWHSESDSNSEISTQGYSDPIRCDRRYGKHGDCGVAVYCKSLVLHKEVCSISCPELEALAMKVCPQNYPSFILVVAYRPDSKNAIEPFFTNF